jgi:D-3-phosphoglycerate dehydrogenase
VAIYGKAFGDANINIAGMQIARETAGGQALSVLTVDSRVPEELLAEVATKIEATTMAHIDIVEL